MPSPVYASLLLQRLLDREANNPDFAFLFEYESKEGQYYRWKVSVGKYAPCSLRTNCVQYLPASILENSYLVWFWHFGAALFLYWRFPTVP